MTGEDDNSTSSAAFNLSRHHVLAEFGRDALQRIELQALLDQAALRVAQAVDVSHSKIMRYRASTADLLIVAGQGWQEGVVGHYCLRTDMNSPAGCAFQTAQPVTINDATNTTFRLPPLMVEHSIMSLANVPIVASGMVWGVLEADSRNKRQFSPEDTDFLHAFASFLGAAIHRQETENEAEEHAKVQATNSLQVDILLRELQHRMKNNLQIILSLISVQRRKLGGGEARDALDHIANRVTAISLAQDQLSTTQRLRTVEFGAYLRALCASMETGRDDVTVEAQAEDVHLSIDQAVPAGLIINEAVTNAIKHAFPGGRSGVIRVSFFLDSVARLGELKIADDGEGFTTARPGGAGIELMGALASQLGGRIEKARSEAGGTAIVVKFPLRL